MLSGKLVHLIESHWEEIISGVIARVRREPQMEHYRARVESEMREWGQVLLENLGHWLTPGGEEIGHRYEEIGRQRFEADVPLHESVRCLCIRARAGARLRGGACLLEEQLSNCMPRKSCDRRLGRFFDMLTIHMVKGYEDAMRKRAPASPAHVARSADAGTARYAR